MEACWTQDRSKDGAAAGYLAVCTVRRSFHHNGSCAPAPRVAPMLVRDLQAAADLFRTAQDRMLTLQGAGLRVAPPGAIALTRHERRLIRATSAAALARPSMILAVMRRSSLTKERGKRSHGAGAPVGRGRLLR